MFELVGAGVGDRRRHADDEVATAQVLKAVGEVEEEVVRFIKE